MQNGTISEVISVKLLLYFTSLTDDFHGIAMNAEPGWDSTRNYGTSITRALL